MRSIPLDDIKKYCVNLKQEHYLYYQQNEDKIRRMWLDQGLEFWVKFTVTLRKYIIQSSSKYDEKCEKEFIVFLKALTHKNYRELESYFRIAGKTIAEKERIQATMMNQYDPSSIKNVSASEVDYYSQLKALTMKLKCAGTLVNILQFWEKAAAGDDFKFTPPESWYIPVQNSEPFESFIRSKWGGYRNIDSILGCKHEELAWWIVPARKVDQSKLKKLITPTTSNANQQQGRDILKKGIKEKKPNWLPNIEHQNVFTLTIKAQASYRNFYAVYALPSMKPSLDYSILPLLKRKYYTIDSRALAEDREMNYQGVCCWYVMCLEAFGNKYMHHVQKAGAEIDALMQGNDDANKNEIREWGKIRLDDSEVLKNMRDKIGAPDEVSDCVDNAMEFLLEPCILIQLPWQPVLFRQWLSAALIEVLKFELESAEFRHWPITTDIEPIVRDLLALVTDLKERVLLGWTVMSYDASMYPHKDKKTFAVVMNDIVLPSINILKFLATGKPQKILRSLKKILWAKAKQEIEDKVDVSRSTFLINGNLSGFFTLFYGHALYFNPYNNCTDPFPTKSHKDNAGLYQQLREIKNDKRILPSDDCFELKVLSIEEKRLSILTQFASFNEPSLYGTTNITKATAVIKNVIIKCKHFSPENCNKLLEIMKSGPSKTIASFIVGNNAGKMSALEHLLVACIFFHDLNLSVQRLKSDTTVLGSMLQLTAMVMEREQLIRVIAACAYILDECPTYCGYQHGKCAVDCVVDKEKPMELAEIKALIKEVKETKTMTKQDLWGQFKEEWRQPVNKNKEVPNLEQGIPNIISHFEDRVGRIVWNASQKAFEKVDNESEAFPELSIVQFILPAHIAYLVDAAKFPESERSTRKLNIIILFIHSMIQHYEETYFKWLEFKGKKHRIEVNDVADMNLRLRCVVSNYYIERVSFVLHGFAGFGRMGESIDSMPHFFKMSQAMLEFPMFNSMGYTSEVEYFNCSSWINLMFPHIEAMHTVCYNVLPVPNTDAILYCHELQDFYFASALLMQLDSYYTLSTWFAVPFKKGQTPEHLMYQDMIKPLRTWHYELFSIIFETENKFDYPHNMIQSFINGNGNEILKNMFEVFTAARDFLASHKAEETPVELPFWGKELQKCCEDFKSGKLHTIALFEEKKPIVDKVVQLQGALATCNNCHRTETNLGTFQKCPSCVANNYPFPNHFCSSRCLDIWWKQEHMAEHLEFDLGLCDFSDRKLTN